MNKCERSWPQQEYGKDLCDDTKRVGSSLNFWNRVHGFCPISPRLPVWCFHMLPVHLLRTAGLGTRGPPDRLLPLPFASVQPFFITGHWKEKHTPSASFLCCDQFAVTTAMWDGDEQMTEWDGAVTTWGVLTWHKRVSNMIAWVRKEEEKRILIHLQIPFDSNGLF